MVYTFGLAKHANIRYRDSWNRLCRYELQAMLRSLSLDCDVRVESFGGADFLSFECRELSPEELSFLSGHSSVLFLSERQGGLLRPLSFSSPDYLEEDLPEVLKYKGKTSAAFTRLMLNMALSLTDCVSSPSPVTVLDPLCGKGTACFCAIQRGMNAIGLDIDQKAVREAGDYFARWLKFHLLKHSVRSLSETVGKASLPVTEFVFADSKEHYLEGDTRFLRLAVGDSSCADALCRRSPARVILADLPYGVQHAPQFGRRPESFRQLLSRVLPRWKKALVPGGALAVSFNTLTFPTQQVLDIVVSSGFTPCEGELFSHLRHEVEQAVVRDVVFATNTDTH
jgi:SAM-dependent methyltransferase